jgi:predicted transcriptional regulator
VISSSYDTFTVASLINRAIYDRLIKKEILLVEDMLSMNQKLIYLFEHDPVSYFHEKVKETGHSRYPVVDESNKVVGIVTAKDVMGYSANESIEKAMTKNPITVTPKTSLASAAHEMVWEGIEMLPVVNDQKRLIGVISRQDVIKSLQYIQKQPQVGETMQDLSFRGFVEATDRQGNILFRGQVTPQMTDSLGTLSTGVLTSIITESSLRVLRRLRRGDLSLQNLSLYSLKPVQLESSIEIIPKILDLGRKQAKLDIEVIHENQVVAKAMMMAQTIER